MGRKEQFLLKNAAYTRLSTCPRTRFPILAFSKSVQSGRFWRPFSKIRIRQICVDGKRIGNVYVFTIQTNSDMGSRSRSQAISQFLPQASSLLYISLHCTDIRAYIYVICMSFRALKLHYLHQSKDGKVYGLQLTRASLITALDRPDLRTKERKYFQKDSTKTLKDIALSGYRSSPHVHDLKDENIDRVLYFFLALQWYVYTYFFFL